MKRVYICTAVLCAFMVISLTLFSFSTAANNEKDGEESKDNLTDIKKHWAEEAINSAIIKGFVKGYADKTFKPDNHVTKAEFITMIVNALGLKTNENTNSPWYNAYVNSAKEAGIYQDEYTESEWNLEITRAEMAKFAIKALNTTLPKAKKAYLPYYNNESFYNEVPRVNVFAHMSYDRNLFRWDYDKVTDYEVVMRDRKFIKAEYKYEYPNTRFNDAAYMFLATTLGIINGVGNGIVDSNGVTTRAQAVNVIEKLLAMKDGKQFEPADKETRENAEFEWHRTNLYTVMGKYLNFQIRGDKHFGLNDGRFKLETDDGKYSGELLKLIVVDMEDSQAIEKYGVDLENWQWNARDRAFYDIKDYHQSYLFIWQSDVSGEDGISYGKLGYLPVQVSIQSDKVKDSNEFINGVLNRITDVVDKRYFKVGRIENRIPVKILPKKYLNGDFYIEISTPSIPNAGEDKYRDLMLMQVKQSE